MQKPILVAAVAAAVVAATTLPAAAQKSKDTLRHLQEEGIATLSNYFDPRPDVQFLSEAAYDGLVLYDFKSAKFAPHLAKSWKIVDDTTYEFTLREDVKWSDGERFDADDVVYTFAWLTDEKTKLRFKANWAFIDKVEKTGPFSVRMTTKRPTPYTLARLTAQTTLVPEHVHGKLEDKSTFGAAPVGTGPYRILQVDKNQGVIGELKEDYPLASDVKPKPTIGRFEIRAVNDMGTQVAELLTGNVDIIREVPVDQAESLGKRPEFIAVGVNPFAITYLMLDMKGRTDVKALQDVRVRQAINHAMNTKALNKLIGGSILDLKRPEALCSKLQQGCGYSVPQPEHDPQKAKKLLAEAGYANGFDLQVVARAGVGQVVAEALTGQLRAVGIRASVDLHTFASYRKQQAEGRQQALVSGWGGGNIPDVASTLSFLFSKGSRDYHGNQKWLDLADKASTEMNDAKRRAIVQELFDEVTQQAYITTTVPSPSIWVHSKDVTIDSETPPFFGYGLTMSEIHWAK